MEPTMLLFLEVFGMIAIAVYVTVAREYACWSIGSAC